MGKKRKKKRMAIEGIECLHGKRGDDGNIRLTLIEYDEHTCICEVCGKHIHIKSNNIRLCVLLKQYHSFINTIIIKLY